MAKGARQVMQEFAAANGWELDPDKTLPATRWSQERVQNPYAFRTRIDGAMVHVLLDYTERSGVHYSTSYNNVLNKVGVSVTFDDGGKISTTLVRPGKYDSYRGLWPALEGPDPGKLLTLPARARLLLTHPALALWLGAEKEHEHRMALRKVEEAREAQERAKAVQMPVTVTNAEFRNLARELRATTDALAKADGTTDLAKVYATVLDKLDDVEAVLTDEIRQAVGQRRAAMV